MDLNENVCLGYNVVEIDLYAVIRMAIWPGNTAFTCRFLFGQKRNFFLLRE